MTTTQLPTTQAQRDEITARLYEDCGFSYAETARQSGVTATTVRARVRRQYRREAIRAARARQANTA